MDKTTTEDLKLVGGEILDPASISAVLRIAKGNNTSNLVHDRAVQVFYSAVIDGCALAVKATLLVFGPKFTR